MPSFITVSHYRPQVGFAIRPRTDGWSPAAARELERQKAVKPIVAVEAPWTDIAVIARQLLDRSFAGKAVLHVKG